MMTSHNSFKCKFHLITFNLLCVGFLIFTSNITAFAASTYNLLVSTSADRSNPVILDGYSATGGIYVFTSPDDSVDRVVFSLDGTEFRTESYAPFDFNGSNPYNTTQLSDGQHEISALISFTDGSSELISSLFTVDNESNPNGRSVPFSWISNTDNPAVDGYKLYYKVGDPGNDLADYNGTDANGNNSSPISIIGQSSTSYILSNLLNSEKYSFVLTAYRGNDESEPTSSLVLQPLSSNNEPPVANGGSISTNKNTTYSGQLSASDPDGDNLTYSVVSNGAKGSVTMTNANTGTFTYTPNQNATGSDTFSFKVNDGNEDSNSANIAVTINAVNEPPVANGGSISTHENTTYSGQLSASDPDGDNLTYSIVSNGSKGSAAITNTSSGTFTYTPNQNATGSDSFSFKVNDGSVNSNTAVVNVSISNINGVPVANSSSITTAMNTPYSGTLSASDPDNDPLTYTIVSNGNLGFATITNKTTGAFTYTPNQDVEGSDSFSFKVNDGNADSSVSTITVTISSQNEVTLVFGDTPDADYTGTLADTFTNLNTDINANSDIISIYNWSGTLPHKVANTIIVKADLAVIPENANIIEATLSLHQTGANGVDNQLIGIHKITGKDPQIDQVNGYNAYNGEVWAPVITGTTHNDIPLGLADVAVEEDNITVNSVDGYKVWHITSMVRDWVVDPSSNKGLLIKGEETIEETGRTFASTQNANSAIRPKLTIRYSSNIPAAPQIISIQEVN